MVDVQAFLRSTLIWHFMVGFFFPMPLVDSAKDYLHISPGSYASVKELVLHEVGEHETQGRPERVSLDFFL